MAALREPSLGPVFGQKGGATGGGKASLYPVDRINLHFNGDFHAIASAHNLLAALIDTHLHFGNALRLDLKEILWPRCLEHERPVAAADRRGDGRTRERAGPRDRVHHHCRVRDHGDHGAGLPAAPTCGPGSGASSSACAMTARR